MKLLLVIVLLLISWLLWSIGSTNVGTADPVSKKLESGELNNVADQGVRAGAEKMRSAIGSGADQAIASNRRTLSISDVPVPDDGQNGSGVTTNPARMRRAAQKLIFVRRPSTPSFDDVIIDWMEEKNTHQVDDEGAVWIEAEIEEDDHWSLAKSKILFSDNRSWQGLTEVQFPESGAIILEVETPSSQLVSVLIEGGADDQVYQAATFSINYRESREEAYGVDLSARELQWQPVKGAGQFDIRWASVGSRTGIVVVDPQSNLILGCEEIQKDIPTKIALNGLSNLTITNEGAKLPIGTSLIATRSNRVFNERQIAIEGTGFPLTVRLPYGSYRLYLATPENSVSLGQFEIHRSAHELAINIPESRTIEGEASGLLTGPLAFERIKISVEEGGTVGTATTKEDGTFRTTVYTDLKASLIFSPDTKPFVGTQFLSEKSANRETWLLVKPESRVLALNNGSEFDRLLPIVIHKKGIERWTDGAVCVFPVGETRTDAREIVLPPGSYVAAVSGNGGHYIKESFGSDYGRTTNLVLDTKGLALVRLETVDKPTQDFSIQATWTLISSEEETSQTISFDSVTTGVFVIKPGTYEFSAKLVYHSNSSTRSIVTRLTQVVTTGDVYTFYIDTK